MWGDPNCEFAGTDYTKYDYAGAGQVAVTGLGVIATVMACAGTAGLACAAGAAGAGVMTSWGNQALDNAGQPVGQAATQVNWGRVAVDAAVGAVSGPIGNGAGRLAGPLTGRIASAATRATVQGSIVGGVSSGASRFLTNVLDGDPNTAATDGLLESCLFGAAVGGLTGRVEYWWKARVKLPKVVNRNPPAYDPLARYGSGRITHPSEYEQALRELQDAGVEVDFRPGNMAYSPERGGPGRMIFDPDGSIGALRHEMQHFRDVLNAGYPGIGPYMAEPSLLSELERRGYQQEIDYALSIGDKQTARNIYDLMMNRIHEITGIYGQ